MSATLGVVVTLAAYAMGSGSLATVQEDSATLEVRWRAAKRAELTAARARVDAAIASLDAGATPETLPTASDATDGVPARRVSSVPAKLVQAGPQISNPPVEQVVLEGPTDTETKKDGAEAPDTSRQKFGGIEFGAGLSYTRDVGRRDRVVDASVVNGVVRVNDENNERARLMLESHYFLRRAATSSESAD